MGGWVRNTENKATLRPALAGALPELGNIIQCITTVIITVTVFLAYCLQACIWQGTEYISVSHFCKQLADHVAQKIHILDQTRTRPENEKMINRWNKLGLSWAMLSSNWNWNWVLLDLRFVVGDWQQAQLRLCKLGPGTVLIFYKSLVPNSIYM